MTNDPRATLENKYRVEAEARHIEAVRSSSLTQRLAEANVAYKQVAETLLKVEDQLNKRDRQHEAATAGLEIAIELVRAMHEKTAPSHRDLIFKIKTCKLCAEILKLMDQAKKAGRPSDSRMSA